MAMYIFTKALFEGQPLPLFNGGKMRRDFTFIDDIVAAWSPRSTARRPTTARKRPAAAPRPHALYNIGNSRSEDLSRVVELLEQATGRTALIDPQPMQPGDVTETFADISAIERDLGFKSHHHASTRAFRASSTGTAIITRSN